MGLRINNNIPAVIALRHLQESDRQQRTSLERLSTGLRINKAQDDPAGLVISEQLRAQIGSLEQAVENSENASNLISTGEAALDEVNSLLVKIRESLIFALNTGGSSFEQIKAEQDAVDYAIASIDRIADTTKFATAKLLNGEAEFRITSQDSSGLMDIRPMSIQFDPTSNFTTFQVDVSRVASQATFYGFNASGAAYASSAVAASGGSVEIRVTGALGSEEILLASGGTVGVLSNAINLVRENTGIYMSNGRFFTDEFGSEESISIEKLGGSGIFTGGASGAFATLQSRGNKIVDFGTDAAATLNGARTSADGNDLTIVSTLFTGTIKLNPATNQDSIRGPGAVGTFNFTIANDTGLLFQFNTEANPNNQEILGIPNIEPTFLGLDIYTIGGIERGGKLTDVLSGGTKDLHNDPGKALDIVDSAIDQVSTIRAFLGAFVHDTVEPTIRSLEVAVENLTASESMIRDLDFARETAEFTRTQILFQAGTSVLAQANLIPQSVLQLLQ